MKKDEVIEKLAKYVSDMVAVGLTYGKSHMQIKAEHEALTEKVIEDLEIPYEFNCDICEDTGETTVMETVYAGEPHQAPTGTQTCICRLHEEDDNQED